MRTLVSQGLFGLRLVLVAASLSPLFILWAIRGNDQIDDKILISICAFIVIVPNVALVGRVHTAKRNKSTREIVVGRAEDHREHLIVYIFTILLPLYGFSPEGPRDIFAIGAVLVLIIFIFLHLNLHYMNIVFAIGGYRVFTVHLKADESPRWGHQTYALITTRVNIAPDERITAYRISDTVYWEGRI